MTERGTYWERRVPDSREHPGGSRDREGELGGGGGVLGKCCGRMRCIRGVKCFEVDPGGRGRKHKNLELEGADPK